MGSPRHPPRQLTNKQMWTIIDSGLTEHARGSREDVLGDLLLYRRAIVRITGKTECERLMALMDDREAHAG
jgi:hypothetical protein